MHRYCQNSTNMPQTPTTHREANSATHRLQPTIPNKNQRNDGGCDIGEVGMLCRHATVKMSKPGWFVGNYAISTHHRQNITLKHTRKTHQNPGETAFLCQSQPFSGAFRPLICTCSSRRANPETNISGSCEDQNSSVVGSCRNRPEKRGKWRLEKRRKGWFSAQRPAFTP